MLRRLNRNVKMIYCRPLAKLAGTQRLRWIGVRCVTSLMLPSEGGWYSTATQDQRPLWKNDCRPLPKEAVTQRLLRTRVRCRSYYRP